MRVLAIINQKGGVGKTTTVANLGAALAREGQRVVVFDLDPQANLSLYLGSEVGRGEASVYGVLTEGLPIQQSLRATATEGLQLVPSHLDLSGAELELASTLGRETLLRDALQQWVADRLAETGQEPADFVIFDCPPSLGLLSVNALVAADEVMIAVQTEFFALQGLSKLVEVIQLLRRRMNPGLSLTGIIPCLYDSRLKLAREVLVELRKYFPGKVFQNPIRTNVRLAESPSFGQTIFEYAPDSNGAKDYQRLAREVLGNAAKTSAPPARSALQAVTDEQAQELQRAAQGLKDLEAQPPEAFTAPRNSSRPAQREEAEDAEPVAANDARPPEPDPVQPEVSAPALSPEDASEEVTAAPQGARQEPAGRSEVDAELAAYEIPRAESRNGEIQPPSHPDKAHLGVDQPEAFPGPRTPIAPPPAPERGAGLQTEPFLLDGRQIGRRYTPKTPHLDHQGSSADTVAPVATLESPAPSTPQASPPVEVEVAPAANSEPTPELETGADSDEEAGPPATPVFGYSHYIGEDRWTQRPRD